MNVVFPLLALGLLVGVIWFLGTGRFGRAQTQVWIDKLHRWPWLHRQFDRHHGKLRALGHYVEFGGLFLVLYWLYDALFSDGRFQFHWVPAIVIALLCMIAAYVDELHQLTSGTRQFRRVDFLHSCCGIALASLLVHALSLLR